MKIGYYGSRQFLSLATWSLGGDFKRCKELMSG